MVSEAKTLKEFTIFLNNMNTTVKDQNKISKELIDIARKQLIEMKNIAQGSYNMIRKDRAGKPSITLDKRRRYKPDKKEDKIQEDQDKKKKKVLLGTSFSCFTYRNIITAFYSFKPIIIYGTEIALSNKTPIGGYIYERRIYGKKDRSEGRS